MIKIIPNIVDSAFLYFHTRRSTGDEIALFTDEICSRLPNTYIWAGDGCIEGQSDDPVMGNAVSYGASPQRYWFVSPMQTFTRDFLSLQPKRWARSWRPAAGTSTPWWTR
jgi:hypothetical protein